MSGRAPELLHLNSAERADLLAAEAAEAHRDASSSGEAAPASAAVAALTSLWRYYSRPELLSRQCRPQFLVAIGVLLGLGLLCRLLVVVVVKIKVKRKAAE